MFLFVLSRLAIQKIAKNKVFSRKDKRIFCIFANKWKNISNMFCLYIYCFFTIDYLYFVFFFNNKYILMILDYIQLKRNRIL